MTGDNRAEEYKWAENFGAGIASLEDGNFAKAARSLETAAAIAEKLELTEPLSNTLIALGDAYRLAEQYDKAEQTFKKAVAFSDKFLEDKTQYAFANAALGRLYIELDKTIEAKNAFEQAVSIFKRQRAEAESESISAFVGLITCYLQLNDFVQGEKLAEYAADLSKSLLGPADSTTLVVMNLWAVCAEARGKGKKAAEIRACIDSFDTVAVTAHG
ncbi:MAG: tetratricopeptide repeat protein [Candidatus Obscuribacterales bacterium]